MFIAIPSSKDREYYIPENDRMPNHQNSLILHVLLDTPFSMCERERRGGKTIFLHSSTSQDKKEIGKKQQHQEEHFIHELMWKNHHSYITGS